MENENSQKTETPTETAPKSVGQSVHQVGRGLVKSVLSGDTIVVISLDKTQKGPPKERTITLSSISAPKPAHRKRRTENGKLGEDDPWAWPSREYLRTKCIGQPVSFIIEYIMPGKELGTVFLGEGEDQINLAEAVVSEGWALAKGKKENPRDQKIFALEAAAKEKAKGIHSKAKGLIRKLEKVEPSILFSQLKGTPQPGVVEQVRNGNYMIIALLHQEIHVFLSGVKCPEVSPPENFGREAKFFTEFNCLNRDVTVILEGVDKFNFYGTVICGKKNIGEELLANGLAKYVEWSGQRTVSDKLKAAEKSARDKRLRVWQKDQAVTKSEDKKQTKLARELTGTVVEVISAGQVVVADDKRNLHKVFLSSITAPRPPIKADEKDEADKSKEKSKEKAEKARQLANDKVRAWEGKEFLRKKLMGQRVRCVLDYTRPGTKTDERAFYSVYLNKNNIAVELVENGHARAISHKGGEERTRDYEFLLLAETNAKKANRGVFSSQLMSYNIKDLTSPDNSNLLAKYEPSFKRGGRMRGVVDYVFGPTKLKIFVPKESAQISLSISGIRGPMRSDKYNAEATRFTRELCHQRDIEFDVTALLKVGNSFVGNVWVQSKGHKKQLAVSLLEAGYAAYHPSTAEDELYAPEFTIAQENAKKAQKKIWENYNEQAVQAAKKKREEEDQQKRKAPEMKDVILTEIINGAHFYVQVVGDETQKLEEMMKALSEVEVSPDPYTPKKNEFVMCQFSEDDTWYRAQAKKVTKEECLVHYVDYGNSEVLSFSRIRPLKPEFSMTVLPAQAHEARLAYVKTPIDDEEYSYEAAMSLREMVWGKTMLATVEFRYENCLYLCLGERESQLHVNAALVRAGLAHVTKTRDRNSQALIDNLREEEDYAKSRHLCIWQYGDIGSDDEDDKPRKKKK